jgi:hypothetical protein
MVFMFYLSLMPYPSLRLIGLLVFLQLLISGIVDWVILLPMFLIFYLPKIK